MGPPPGGRPGGRPWSACPFPGRTSTQSEPLVSHVPQANSFEVWYPNLSHLSRDRVRCRGDPKASPFSRENLSRLASGSRDLLFDPYATPLSRGSFQSQTRTPAAREIPGRVPPPHLSSHCCHLPFGSAHIFGTVILLLLSAHKGCHTKFFGVVIVRDYRKSIHRNKGVL